MGSTGATLGSSPAPEERPQYQHFIPRLILRGFAQDPPCINSSSTSAAQSKKQRNKRRKSGKDGVLHFIRTQDGSLGDTLLSRHYGMIDMYRDMSATDQNVLEKKLSRLESQAGDLLARARQTFARPGASLLMTRQEKDILRKFLFLMKYRNNNFYSRFNVGTIDEYTADDKEKMGKYVQDRGFRSPREVWLDNIHAFLDLEMDAHRDWHTFIQRRAYQDDALLFILHLEQSYMVFCRPQSVHDEFILTDNVFGIFEGPNSLAMNPATGELTRGVWTEWHNFAPVSSTLLIILRNNYLPGNVEGAVANADKIYGTLLAMHPFPEHAVSILQDLPVRRSANSYSTVQDNKVVPNAGYQGPSLSDQYTFECFELESTHVNLINSIFLEEAMTASSVTYKNDSAMVRATQKYLEDTRPGFKVVHGTDSARRVYLGALEKALDILGGTARLSFDMVPVVSVEPHPWDYGGHMARWVAFQTAFEILDQHPRLMEYYRTLGGRLTTEQYHKPSTLGTGIPTMRANVASLRFYEDVEQAGKITFLHIKIDSALSVANGDVKRRCKMVRQQFFASLHPRRIWLYIKVLRNLKSFDANDFTRQIRPLQCEGPEDEAIRRE